MTLTAIYKESVKSGLFFRQAIATETARKGHASYYSETAEGMLKTCSCAVFIRAAGAPMRGTDVTSPLINSSHEKIGIQKDQYSKRSVFKKISIQKDRYSKRSVFLTCNDRQGV